MREALKPASASSQALQQFPVNPAEPAVAEDDHNLPALSALRDVGHDGSRPWWVAVPKAIYGELAAFWVAIVVIVVGTAIEYVMRGVLILSASVFAIALAGAIVVAGIRWLVGRR